MGKFNLTDLLGGKQFPGGAAGVSGGGKESEAVKVEYIDIDNLIPSEQNFYQVSAVDDLKESIELVGVKQNLLVAPAGVGKYKILAGHRRSKAIKELVAEGKEEFRRVPCVVDYSEDAARQELLLIMTNSTTRELTDWEKIEQVKRLKPLLQQYKKEHGIKGRVRDMTAEVLGVSASQVGRLEAIENNLSPEFKEEMKNGNVKISAAYEVAKQPEEKQKHMFEEYKETGEIKTDGFKLMLEDYRKLQDKVQREGYQALSSCEACKLATVCQGCCRECENPCNVCQPCRREENKNQDYREEMVQKESQGQTSIVEPYTAPELRKTNFEAILEDKAKLKEIIVRDMKASCNSCPCETEDCAGDCTYNILKWLDSEAGGRT